MECTGSGTAGCPDKHYCSNGMCLPLECTERADCDEDEYCYANMCHPQRPNGEPCKTGPIECQSGLCGKVDDVNVCVAPCEWEDTYPWPPHQCSEGFLCVGPGNVLGAENGHYCWPQGASDYKPVGEPCGSDPADWGETDDACESGWCGYDGNCGWPCSNFDPTCFPGLTCQDAFGAGECGQSYCTCL